MRYVPRPLVLAAIASLLLPVVVHGQDGVQLDPDSPAGVEYQLPLEQARKNAGGGGDGGAGVRDSASLFGVGIAPAGEAAGARGGGDGGARDGGGADGGGGGEGPAADTRSRGRAADSSGATIRPSTLGGQAADEGSAALPVAGIALAVLLVGGLLGLALRRGLRHSEE